MNAHKWQRSTFTGTMTCELCNLLPLDEDDTNSECPSAGYFRWCPTCNCFEYDCHGLPGCIKHEPGYRNAHQRASDRKANA